MKKTLTSIITVTALLGTLGVAQQTLADTVGLVDMQKVTQAPAVREMMRPGGNRAALQAAYQRVQKLEAAQKKAKGQKAAALKKDATKAQASFQALMQKEQVNAKAKQEAFQAKMMAAIASVSKKENLDSAMVKQVILYHKGDNYVDITDKVVQALSK